jgi:DNA-binding transcriptional MocR family regulator
VLPPVRVLAADLGIAAGTVAAAYRLLVQRGVVETNRRAGTRIRPRPAALSGRREVGLPEGLVDLASGNPDPALLPSPRAAMEVVAKQAAWMRPGLYGDPAVLPELAAWARERFRAEAAGLEAVTVVSGALDAVERALQSHVRPGMRVAAEDPGYAGLLDLLSALGLLVEPVRVDEEGMTADGLARALGRGAQAVILTPRAQNPTGAALSEDRAAELAELLDSAPEALVIEDDHAGPIAGVPHRSIVSGRHFDERRRAMIVRSCSKALGPDLRVALVAGDPETVAAIEERRAVGSGWTSHLLQALACVMLSDPECDLQLAEVADVYTERREALISSLAARGVAAHGRSGLNVWVPVADEAKAVAGMAARGWAVAAGARFRTASPPGVRVTTAALDFDDAETVAESLAASLGPTGRTRSG